MVSNVHSFQRHAAAMPKFGATHPDPSLVKGAVQAAESPAAQKAKELVKPSVSAAFEIAPAIIRAVNGAVAASIGLYLSKRIAEQLFPTAAVKSLEHELAEAKLKKRAESIGTETGKLAALGSLLLTGITVEGGKEIIKTGVGLGKELIPKKSTELEKITYQLELRDKKAKLANP